MPTKTAVSEISTKSKSRSHSIPIDSPNSSKRVAHGETVWIDIDNSPHVPFFLPIIDELQKQGFKVVLTARDAYQVCDLLKYHNLSCNVIGSHYGKNKILKILGTCLRVIQLMPFAVKSRPNLAVSHGSRAQVLVCKLLGVRTLMLHDYEHSIKTSFLEPDYVFMPEVIPVAAMSRHPERIMTFPGLKEDVYVPRFQPDPSILNLLGISPKNLLVTLRPPATEAHYHNAEADELLASILRLLAAKSDAQAVMLPRNAAQGTLMREQWADLIATGQLVIPKAPLDGLNLIWYSDLVISGGGTMNREAAALGVPVYSIFRGKMGGVDKYLVKNNRLTMIESVEDVKTKIALSRRKRPAKPENINNHVLQVVVKNIATILEKK